jgi:hypothetical protein
MRSRLLVRHFLSQFVENEFSPDIDRHQVLALTAAGLITVPLFVTVFMGWKYLMQPLQAPGWTEATALGDQIFFCATSMLVSAIVATLEWDALALSPRDSLILGVLPLPRREIVRAKLTSLATFAAAFVIALNALPMVLHPALMVANLPLNPLMLLPLMAAHGLSTVMAGALGFSSVVALRESLYLSLGHRGFLQMAGLVRSALLFLLLVLLALAPIRLAGRADWMMDPGSGPALLRPVSWFVATHVAIAGRVLERLPQPDLPTWRANQEDRLRAQYRRRLPHLTGLAFRGTSVLIVLLIVSLAMYLWNARRFQVLPDRSGPAMFRAFGVTDGVATALVRRPAKRAGLLFLVRTMLGNPLHRFYLVTSTAIGVALLIAMAPAASVGDQAASTSIETSELASQTLIVIAILAGLRAAIRTSADSHAGWLFGIVEASNIGEFRKGVRLGVIIAIMVTVLLLLPLHAAAWGVSIAAMHAVNGAAVGWLLVELACGDVEQPLVLTIPPNDGLNTVGVALLGAMVILVFVLARIEGVALTGWVPTITFAVAILFVAACVRYAAEKNQVLDRSN